MVDYAAEIERIVAENRRRMSLLMGELDDANRRTERNAHACAEFFASEARREQWEREHARKNAEIDTEHERQEARAREQREVIARVAAFRKANELVGPFDDEDDDYYRRESWLV
jgi:hypothetical protein